MRAAAVPFPDDLRAFVDSTPWTFAKTYAATWPHEYVVRTPENAAMMMDPTPDAAGLINRCDESHTYAARLAAGTLPK